MSVSTQETIPGLSEQSVEPSDSSDPRARPSPGGAFVRSLAIPGWGQAVSGSPGRGAFYFTVQSVTVWMILKTTRTLGSASDILAMRRLEAMARLLQEEDES